MSQSDVKDAIKRAVLASRGVPTEFKTQLEDQIYRGIMEDGGGGGGGGTAGGLMKIFSEGSVDITNSMTNMYAPEVRYSVGDYFTFDGSNVVAAKPCFVYVYAALNSTPQESGFSSAANFRLSIKQFKAETSKTSIISEARKVILRWDAHTVQFSTGTIVQLGVNDRLFCQCAQYAAYSGESAPTRKSASIELGVFVLMPSGA